MEREDFVQKIKTELNEVSPDTRPSSINSHIQNAMRALNLIKADEAGLFKKFGTDLLQLYSGEISFQKINKKEKGEFSDSFFRSYEILKKDILKALENHSK